MRDAAYGMLQDVWSAWLRRRMAGTFAGVERFCLFVGYPRSGHSLIGALLNAHRDAVVAHELDVPPLILAGCSRDELYARIIARSRWFHLRGDRSNYDYRVPDQWQGRFARLRVIGDKRGGAVTRCLGQHPDFLARVRALVGVPLRLIHVVRNPFDNVAAISLWQHLSLEDSARFYFDHCAVTAGLATLCAEDELLTVHHEEMLRDPAATLARLCASLGLDPDPGYVASCCSIVFPQPTQTRHKVAWPDGLIDSVAARARSFPQLAGYAFVADASGDMRTKLG